MGEILLPHTDAGALVQAVVAVPVALGALFATRHDREIMIFVLGLTVMTFAWFAARTVH